MRKIIFAGDWVLEQRVGVQRYAYQILLELDKMIDSEDIRGEFELLIPENNRFRSPFQNIRVVEKGRIESKFEKHIWQQWTFPRYVTKHRALGVDLAGAFPLWGCAICAMHDCIREAFPENFNQHGLYLKLYYFKASHIAENNKVQIVTLTNDAKRELKKYYHISDDRIHIVTCGWEHMRSVKNDDSIMEKLGLNNGCRFFFSLGSKYKHKNFRWVIEAAKVNPQFRFIITGTGIYSDNEEELKKEIPKNVIFTGYISDEEIKSLMTHCEALIQPSFYEGFGLPPLEALAVGSKIIVSNQSAFPEIYGKAAYYIDPYVNTVDLEKILAEAVASPNTVLEAYSWSIAAKQLLDLLQK